MAVSVSRTISLTGGEENSLKHPRHHSELPLSFTLSLAAKVAAVVTGAKRGACHLNIESKETRQGAGTQKINCCAREPTGKMK